MTDEAEIIVTTGERLDKALSLTYPQYSRSALEKLILDGYVTVNGVLKRSSYKIKEGDDISVDLTLFTSPVVNIEIPIIYEDDDVVVLDKPAGVLTHAKGTLHNEATVATWLKAHSGADGANFWSSNRAGIVHRLDRVTSGVIICAKNEAAQTHLQKQFSDRKAKKSYLAVVEGQLDAPNGTIDVPIERNPKQPATFRPGINGKSAQTTYSVLETSGDRSILELRPYTGRTHQLRVHMQYMGHPIVGDQMYGAKPDKRLYLHAHSLEITLPSRERKIFTSTIPAEFSSTL